MKADVLGRSAWVVLAAPLEEKAPKDVGAVEVEVPKVVLCGCAPAAAAPLDDLFMRERFLRALAGEPALEPAVNRAGPCLSAMT